MTSEARQLDPGRAILLPLTFAAILAGVGLLLRSNATMAGSTFAAAGLLAAWSVVLFLSAKKSGRTLHLSVVARAPHYVQLMTQLVIYGYWAYHTPMIRTFPVLIAAQLTFAYGFSTLLAWSRRDHFELGFGPFPIILSINLFLLFLPDWFYWQFVMVAMGWSAKEFIRWEKNGRSAHIFNPSSFPLAVFAIILIATESTSKTLGIEIAARLFDPPQIHTLLFLVSIPVQILFGVATMTIAAVVAVYGFGVLFFQVTGTYFFYDAYLPIAVFLGMHLLQTDPSTSPRTETGRIVFGTMYGMGVVGLVVVLRALDAPAFYDKLLPVLFLNLTIQKIDSWVTDGWLKPLDLSKVAPNLTGIRRNAAIVTVWVVIFAGIKLAGGVSDEHPGQWVPFWETACADGSGRACNYLDGLEQTLCLQGSGWACNELGVRLASRDDRDEALGALREGCELDFEPACRNGVALSGGGGDLALADPTVRDLPYLIRGSKGPITETDPTVLLARACELGFRGTCDGRSFAGQE